jgi:hypothetical protein
MQKPEGSHYRHGSFRGPTSMAFSLDVANSTIANMGYRIVQEPEEPPQPTEDPENLLPPGQCDPLLEFDKDELVRLCRLHEDEVGIMYPVLDIQTVIAHAKNLVTYLESLGNQRPREPINDEKTLQLKMVMCCALVVEEHGHSLKAEKIYRSMETVINRKLMSDPSDFASLPLLALLAGYRFLSNDEVLSWRVIGQVARLCLELGINQRTGLMAITDDVERKNALSSFWTAYVLDRRWAFGTGLPYVVQDSDIDPQLPLPVSKSILGLTMKTQYTNTLTRRSTHGSLPWSHTLGCVPRCGDKCPILALSLLKNSAKRKSNAWTKKFSSGTSLFLKRSKSAIGTRTSRSHQPRHIIFSA